MQIEKIITLLLSNLDTNCEIFQFGLGSVGAFSCVFRNTGHVQAQIFKKVDIKFCYIFL